jgi:peroxiredoxin
MHGSQSDLRFVLFLLAASLATNVFLAYRVLRPGDDQPAPIAVGQVVPPAEVATTDGRQELIRYSEQRQPTLVYVFSPSCHFCSANVDNIKALFQARGSAYRFVGVSLQQDGLTSYVQTHDLKFSVYSATPHMQSTYRLNAIPQTLLIEPSGRVLRAWTGAYVGETKRQVEEFFKTQLPGSTADAS